MEYSFWAIIDEEDAVVSVIHEKYGEVKAVFKTKEDAEKAIELNARDPRLHIEEVEIRSA